MKTRAALSVLGVCLSLLLVLACGSENNEPQQNTVSAPSLTPVAGTYSSSIDVAMSTTTPEAVIRYTTDASTPTEANGTAYAGPVHIAVTTTLKAAAFRAGWTGSAVTTATYTIAPLAAAPAFDPGPGTYPAALDVTITTSTPGASLRYTTDGSTPTSSSGTVYDGPVHLPVAETTLKAVAYQTGFTTSLVTSGLYVVGPLAAAPAFDPAPGDYLDPQDVTITTSTPGASIRYTTDGSTPTAAVGTLYAAPVHVAADLVLKALAFEAGYRSSPVTSGTYAIGLHVAAPQLSPPPGTYSSEQDIAITTTTGGATIRYTADGTAPTETMGTVYTAPVRLSQSATLKAVAYRSGWVTSPVTSGLYTIAQTVAAPEFGVPPGTYGTARSVAITTATPEAAIRFTTDGSTPTATHGTVYASPVRVARSLTLKAVAYRSGWTTSSVTSGEYKRVGVSAGAQHSLLAKADGTVWAWGGNTEGQLGNGTTNPAATPALIAGISGVVDVAAGYFHSVALKDDGTVWAWGRNIFGQAGDGTTTQRLAPVQAAGISGATAIACGENSTYALKEDGTVWAWGRNSRGQLGDGTTNDRYAPIQVPGLSGIVAIAAGELHALALESDGTLWAWGDNTYGALGDGTANSTLVPVPVPGLSGLTGIAANGFHSAAVKNDGTLWSWGSGGFGELGIGTQPLVWPFPTAAPDLATVAAAGAGSRHTIVLLAGGSLRACGFNFYGQLGDGTNTDRPLAVLVPGLSSVVDAAGGFQHSLAVKSDGTVWAWGYNLGFELGDGTTTSRSLPVQVVF